MTDKEYVIACLSYTTILQQLAEESSELAQASLKLIRAMGNGNPTPIALADAKAKMIEEANDVAMCLDLLGVDISDVDNNPKWQRWAERLRMMNGEQNGK